jgi:hypothetical protein
VSTIKIAIKYDIALRRLKLMQKRREDVLALNARRIKMIEIKVASLKQVVESYRRQMKNEQGSHE